MSEKNCPRCGSVRLSSIEVAPIVLERCTKCGGSFLEKSQFDKVVELSKAGKAPIVEPPDAQPKDAALRDPIACPVCTKTMRNIQRQESKIFVDVCREHGLWLDGGEIAAIITRDRERREGKKAWDETKDDAKSVGSDVAVAVAGGVIDVLIDVVVGIF